MEAGHEGLAAPVAQDAALAAHRLADQEAAVGVAVKAGGMELAELHVRDPGSRAPGHGHAVARGDVGVGGVEVGLGPAARGQDRGLGQERVDFAGGRIEGVGPESLGAAGEQVHAVVALVERDARRAAGLGGESALDLVAGQVGGVQDAPGRVAALARQVVGGLAALALAGEAHAPFDEVIDALGAIAHHGLHHLGLAKARARLERILDMGQKAVVLAQNAGNAALGVGRVAFHRLALAQDRHFGAMGCCL